MVFCGYFWRVTELNHEGSVVKFALLVLFNGEILDNTHYFLTQTFSLHSKCV